MKRKRVDMRANRNRDKMYMCMGENIKSNARIGDVGDVKSLMGWCMHLSHRDRDELEIFFDESYTNNDIVNYIYNSWGNRLKAL